METDVVVNVDDDGNSSNHRQSSQFVVEVEGDDRDEVDENLTSKRPGWGSNKADAGDVILIE